jgi:hypothetical protein
LVDFGGFCFTAGGISHNVTQADLDELAFPAFAPPLVPDVEHTTRRRTNQQVRPFPNLKTR